MVFAHRMHPNAEKKDQHSQNHEKVRQALAARSEVAPQEERPVAVQQEQQRTAQNGEQEQNGVPAAPGGDVRVEEGEEDHRDPEKKRHQPAGNAAGEGQAGVPGHKPDGNGGLIEPFFPGQEGDERVQHGRRDWQNDLAPHEMRVSGPFQTGERNAGHCRADHTQRHQPGQRVFAADVEMNSVFHNNVIISNITWLGNKKSGRNARFLENLKLFRRREIKRKCRIYSDLARAAMNAGVVPQQPPSKVAPLSRH